MKLNASAAARVSVAQFLVLILISQANVRAGLERIEVGPGGSSMRGRMVAATDVQFGVHVSGTLDQQIEKLRREVRLLEFTRDTFPAMSKAVSYAGTNVPMSKCVEDLSGLAGKTIPMELGTNSFSAKEFVFRDLPLMDVLKYLVAFGDVILDVSDGKLVCRPVRQALALDSGEFDLLQLMTSQKYREVEKILRTKKPDVRHIQDQDRQTLLHFAAWHDQGEILKALLELGAEVNVRSSTGYTPLHEAARFGNAACVEVLLRNGADVSLADNNNDTPLETALYYGYRDVAKLLVDHGAKLDIFTASGLGMTETVRKLLDAPTPTPKPENSDLSVGPIVYNLGFAPASSGWAHATGQKGRHSVFGGYEVTPLHCAARGGSVEVAELLIQRGMSVSARDSQGGTPLHWAADEGQLETAKYLLRNGADLDATNLFGSTPLLVVARGKVAPAMVKFLVEAGANVNAVDSSGENALHKLAWFGYPQENIKAAETLLNAGADVNAMNSDGKTPLDILLDNGYRNEDLVELYRKHAKDGK